MAKDAKQDGPAGKKPAPQQQKTPPSLYEQVRGRRRKGTSVFWGEGLVLSVVLHLVLLLILMGMQFGTPHVAKKAIKIDAEIIEDFKPEPVQVRSVINMSQSDSIAERGAKLAEKLKGKDVNVPVMGVDSLDVGGMGFDLLGRKQPGRSTAWQTGDLTGKVGRKGDQNYESAMDALARVIIKEIQKRKLLVAICFDGSRSLLADRELLGAQIKRTMDELKFAIVEKQERRLTWCVVLYSDRARVVLDPTRDVLKVQKKLKDMPLAESGKENVIHAVDFCLDNLSRKADRLFILLLTDEQGDDNGIDSKRSSERNAIRRVVDDCRKKKARIFVLGRESLFHVPKIHHYVKVKENGKEVTKIGWQDIGLATRDFEFIQPKEGIPLGANHRTFTSGFGCYALSMLAHKSGGTFFIISTQPSPYNQSTMQLYEPEWVYPEEYDSRVRRSKLRRTLRDIREDIRRDFHWGQFRTHGPWKKQKSGWNKHLDFLEDRLRWCEKATDRLKRIKSEVRLEGHARRRWAANYDLTLGQIYKIRAMLIQHQIATKKLLKEQPKPPPEPKNRPPHIVLRYWLWPRGDRKLLVLRGDAGNEITKAENALNTVIKNHPGTPWAAQAQYEINTINGIVPYVDWYSTQHPPIPVLGM